VASTQRRKRCVTDRKTRVRPGAPSRPPPPCTVSGHATRPEVPLVLTVICMLVLILSFTVGAYFSAR
jgi:hypothetical protein